MKRHFALAAFLMVCLSGCSTQTSPPVHAVGGDRDAHGCIGSAGYAWCAGTGQCERPWELADKQGFKLSQQAFDAFCRN